MSVSVPGGSRQGWQEAGDGKARKQGVEGLKLRKVE